MTGMLCSNYSHGIVSQNCFAKLYSDLEIRVQLIITGTFVQVHSIQDDDVLFCIVRDDMQVEFDQMVCKKADIINVPESLWGPLFTVKKVARLPLVKDSKIAESIGNISVGHTVQVLGPDNSVICIANVTFRNSIGRLGVGIYFGLQVLSSKENLSAVIKKVSLLEPGTKGFPRGCDIVVTVDKILPSNCSLSVENSVWNHEKENHNQLVKNLYCKEDSSNGGCKGFSSCCIKDKLLNESKKMQHRSNLDISHNLKKMINSDNSLNVGDEVIYLNGDTPEKGVVRWLGLIENSLKVGVEFDNPIGNGKNTVEGLGEVFQTKYQHSLFVTPTALIKLSDYKINNLREDSHCKKNHNNSNNNCSFNKSAKAKNNNCINNNNEFINSNDFCYSGQENSDERLKKLKKVSITHHCLKHERSVDSNNSFQAVHLEEEFSGKDFVKNQLKSEVQHNWKSFDAEKPCERKISCRSNSNCVDKCLVQTEPSSSVSGNNLPNFLRWNPPPQNIYDSTEAKQERIHGFPHSKVQKCPNEEDEDVTFYKTVNHPSEKNNRNFQEVKLCNTFDEKLFRSSGLNVVKNFKKMSGRVLDEAYIPLPVLEQSNLAKKSNSIENGNIIYDVPSRDIRRIDDEPFTSKDFCPSCRRNSFIQNFNEGRRDTLAPSTFNFEINELTSAKKDKWECQYSQPSNSDEHLRGYCEALVLSEKEKAAAEELGKGSMVELTFKGKPHFGVIRWIGTMSEKREDGSSILIAGVEMEEESPDFTDGILNNKRYFQCNPHKGLFVPLSKCRKDSRFLEDSQKQSLTSKVNYGQIDCPVVEGTIPPINTKGDLELICGKNRGIQGHHNSCYLDATLFSMFAFTSVFDSLLYRPPTSSDIPQYNEVQRVLREEIVNPLRKNLYVRADRVMKLRTLLEKLSSISGLTSEEKDPEEFLNSLLAQILKAEPFLKLSSGQEAFHYQLFVEKDERLTLPSVQLLFEQSFVTSDIKLKQVPSCLIIQMPRFGKAFKMYSRILPPQLLDITDIIENSPRQCTVCGKLAEFECKDCFGQQGIGNGLESISFCKACLDTAHNHHCRSSHNSRALTVPVEFYELQDHCIIPRLFMELFAVVCIETSHYVAFVKCGSGSDAPWCFFDSMADRKGEQNGYNIPEMVPCPDLNYWLSEEGVKILSEMQDERQLPEHAKRLFSDAYMCMYQSPDLMMYR